jgi:hypothetical protein
MLCYTIEEVKGELLNCQRVGFWGKFTVVFENGKIYMLNISETKKKEQTVKKSK